MKLRAKLGVALLLAASFAASGCSRNGIEAVNLANEGDKQRNVDLDGAISKYEQAVTLDPTNHRIMWKLAMAYRKKEAWDKVASTLARAVQIAPKFANYWYERAYAIEQQATKEKGKDRWEEAKEPLKKCIEADPNYADCYHELGWVNLWTDDEQNALANFTKAIEHKADEARYYPPLGDLYLNLGYDDQAGAVLKEGISFAKPSDKSTYALHVLMSEVYSRKGQANERVGELEAAKKLNDADASKNGGLGDHPEIMFNLGSTYAVLNPPRKTEAIQLLKRFSATACKGASAATKYKDPCEQSQALIAKLGGS